MLSQCNVLTELELTDYAIRSGNKLLCGQLLRFTVSLVFDSQCGPVLTLYFVWLSAYEEGFGKVGLCQYYRPKY